MHAAQGAYRQDHPSAQRLGRLALLGACLALMSACSMLGSRQKPGPGPAPPVPRDIQSIPDAVPKWEQRTRAGNPASYEIFGKRYHVLSTDEGYAEQGVASWYGPGFHGKPTSMGETYDMYAMTAAHKTLPIPTYARVTNLRNGRSIVVRINDRGPFVGNRIIDLSYVAAAKLDMLREGTALVEVRTLTPGRPDNFTRAAQSPPATLYIQAGAFADETNARRLVQKLQAAGMKNAIIRAAPEKGRRLHRVRVGPVSSVEEFDRLASQLARLGVPDAHLTAD